MKEFITSDYHIGHPSICGPDGFVEKRKHFKSVEEMNEAIIETHNKYVGNSDVTYNLGDISLGLKPREIFAIIKRMKGHFHFDSGNHDSSKIRRYFLNNNYEMPDGKMKILGFDEVGFRKKVDGKVYLMTHYPMHVGDFRRQHRSFFGHIHEGKGQQATGLHVGIDSTELPEGWEFARPLPFEKAIEMVEEKQRLFLEEHNASV